MIKRIEKKKKKNVGGKVGGGGGGGGGGGWIGEGERREKKKTQIKQNKADQIKRQRNNLKTQLLHNHSDLFIIVCHRHKS